MGEPNSQDGITRTINGKSGKRRKGAVRRAVFTLPSGRRNLTTTRGEVWVAHCEMIWMRGTPSSIPGVMRLDTSEKET